MNEKIVALKGKGGIGKSTTLNLLPDQLKSLGWKELSNKKHGNKLDFIAVYSKKDILLGVSTAGDNYREVSLGMRKLRIAKCSVFITACRSFDRINNITKERKGTHSAMRELTSNITFVNKTIEPNENIARRNEVNKNDIERIINLI